jgi:1-acyl-sn-glycerol-3-phosphate acyltransferase
VNAASAPATRRSILERTRRAGRAAWRLARACALTAALALAWFGALPFCAGNAERRRRLRGYVFSRWSRACLAAFNVRVTVKGAPPKPPCFLVSNHLCYLDILVLASQMNAVFVSMAELVHWPFIGWMASSFGTVYIDRRKKRDIPAANKSMESFLEKGFIVALFPEGTSSCGETVAAFRPSLLEPAAHMHRPVASATLRYETGPRDLPASQCVCWVQSPFVVHFLRLLTIDRIDSTLIFHEQLIAESDRKVLAERLHNEVQSRFEPLR